MTDKRESDEMNFILTYVPEYWEFPRYMTYEEALALAKERCEQAANELKESVIDAEVNALHLKGFDD